MKLQQFRKRRAFGLAPALSVRGLFFICAFLAISTSPVDKSASIAWAATGSGTDASTRYVKWDKINVYARKSESSTIVKTLKWDKKVTLLNQPDDRGWVKIKIPNGKKGYVLKRQLSEKNRKERCAEDCIVEWEITKPKVEALGWKLMSSGELEYVGTAQYPRVYQESWFTKDGYKVSITNFSKIHNRYTDGRIRRFYGWQIYENDKIIWTSIGYTGTTRRGLMKILSEY